MAEDRLVLDPGLDLAKTPEESVEILRRLPELEALGRPLLLAISRKDFVGALTGRRPAERDAGTLGAIEPALDAAAARPARARRGRGAGTSSPCATALREPVDGGRRAPAGRDAAAGGGGVSAFTIAQISDLHCGSPHFVPSLLDRAIVEINELEPDVVIVSRRPDRRRPARRSTSWRASTSTASSASG